MTRRDFVQTLGGGILVMLVEEDILAQESGGGGRRRSGDFGSAPQNVNAWLHIGQDGVVTVYTGKVEVGQNARTSLTQAAAEELHAPPASIRLVMGDTALTPVDMGTVGSMTTPRMWPQIRRAAAAAREMLIELGARKWGVDAASVTLQGGRVVSGSHSAGFGELTQGQELTRSIPASAALAAPDQWKVAGTSLPKVDGRAMVTGEHRFTFDMRRPGMLHAKVLYPPSFNAKLKSLDDSAAKVIPGVRVVRVTANSSREGAGRDLVGVLAPAQETAEQALAALKAEWQPVTGQTNSQEVYTYFKRNGNGGTPGAGLTSYTVAYIAHTPLEPRAALAEWGADGKLTVWTGSQRPFGVRSELAGEFKVPEEQVRVIVPDTGSGYGGKHTGDAALEAALLAKAVGQPVKRNWTREEEMTWAYFRPGALMEVGGKAAPDGTLTSWEFHNYNSGSPGLQTPYAVAQKKEQVHSVATPLRQGSYRCLAATGNNFVRESYMDELAHSIHLDPLEFRLKNTRDERLRNVMTAAAERFGWKNRRKTAGRGFGMAAGTEKGGYVACCVEVSAANGQVKVVRVVEAFECGAIVNPEHLSNQVEGAIAMGLGGALFEHIDFADGKILTNRLSRYRVPRMADMPVIESVLLDRKDLPSAGSGESPIMCVAPAVGNAIFDATGIRMRSMPMVPKGLPSSAGATASAVL
jgi:nicotinate dehydrogenase subunit B